MLVSECVKECWWWWWVVQGCYAALFQVNPDLWHDVSIFTVITIIQALSLGPGFLQVRHINFVVNTQMFKT